ncbi:MAG TPA: lysophospholipid acyltransferase family protein [Lacipirellulaceae bacterium]|jgi:1-acyl-sn-glycerol-3-phosphate acyltransferase|nr:lysophospholipid acyltransferase family protein [Lacipirellulaceae bacterium]
MSRRQETLSYLWYAALWCACYAFGQLFFRFKFSGKQHVPPTGPVLLVSNHQSNLDPVLVGVACPRELKYMARKGLFFFPLGLWIRALGAVPIDQEGSALAGIRVTLDLLKQNNALLVFPEGSRSPDGKLHKIMPGFCLLARRSKATIVPLALEGAFAALPRGKILVNPHPIALKFGGAIPPAEYSKLSDAQLTELVAKRIAEQLAAVRQELAVSPAPLRFWRRKRENLLLASPVEPAWASETAT